MTMPIRFDTQHYIKTLMEGGHSQEQAEAQALALTTALGEGSVASSELLMVKVELSSRMDALKAEMLARVDLIRAEMLARVDLVQAEMLARMELLKVQILAAVDRKLAPLYFLHAVQIAALIALLLKLYG
jgi:hypothetical protein